MATSMIQTAHKSNWQTTLNGKGEEDTQWHPYNFIFIQVC